MNKQPTITVVTVCLNAKAQLQKTIDSVMRQTYQSVDFWVIDGKSDDGTLELLESTKSLHWISEPDEGIYDAMNKGIMNAKGEWVIFMNAGDTFASDDTIEKVFRESQDADIIYGDVIKGDKVKKALKPRNSHRMFYCHQSAFVRISCLRQFMFDTSHRMSADFKQVKQMYLAGKRFRQLDLPIAVFDTTGISNTSRSKGLADNISIIREIDSWYDKLRLLPRILFTYHYCKLRGK